MTCFLREQVYFPLKFKDELIGKTYCDFIVEEKIIVELKKDSRFSKAAILINFTSSGQFLSDLSIGLSILVKINI